MQKQQRRPGADNQGLDRYSGDLDAFHSRSSHLFSRFAPVLSLRVGLLPPFAGEGWGGGNLWHEASHKSSSRRKPGSTFPLARAIQYGIIIVDLWATSAPRGAVGPGFAGTTDRWRERNMGQFGIGQPVRRFEDKRLLCGNGRFQHDVSLPGQAYAVVLRSPHAHAATGMLAIYTGYDLAAAGLGTMGVPFRRQRPDGTPMFWRAHLGLARERV